MLRLNGSIGVNQSCLRFEIHGCKLSDSIELFPSFKSNRVAITTNALYVQKAAVIMSIGYPFLTGSGYSYTWIIDFKYEHYVRLIFTNVTLNQIKQNNDNGCEDMLVIGTHLLERLKGVQINTNFNERIFIVETNRTLVLVTFQPCFNTFRGSSFRAVVNQEDIPACLSIASSVDWSRGRNEACTNPEMILTSMSILNIPFENFEERFKIQARNHHGIQIEFIDFYIVCQRGTSDIRSKFAMIEGNGKKEYCNANKPPKIVYSEENYIHIVFRRYDEPSQIFLGREGFRLQFRTKSFTLEKWTDTNVNSLQKSMRATQVCSKKFRKCYTVFQSSISWYEARYVCWQRNEHLITIQSQKELLYINYLLREQRYKDQRNGIYDSKSFKAHIGLLRSIDTDKKNGFYWVNSHEVTFTAWAVGQPSVGDCTRTNFRSFNTDRTWETEDCKNELADYFICQTEEEKGKLNVFNKGMCNSLSKKNKIKISYSYSGKACQRWSNLTENNHLIVDKDKDLFNINSDFCEDPSDSGIFGCNVNNTVISWEPCFFSQADPVSVITESFGDHFSCNSTRRHIPLVNKCDKSFHCEDKTDEMNCTMNEHGLVQDVELFPTIFPERLEEGSYFQCGSKEWISIAAKCDTVIDCLDASDEIYCLRNNAGCNKNEFACADGSCIKQGQVCDFKPDCTNADDEFCELRNCGLNEYVCDNKQCIPYNKSCDAVPHCIDGSDEIKCASCRDSFHCDVDRCISNILVCDKVRDCQDGSDESDCTDNHVLTCGDLWERGYHESGQYLIDGINVYCDYRLTGVTSRSITMEIKNLDWDPRYAAIHTFTSEETFPLYLTLRGLFNDLFFRNNSICTMDVQSTCHLSEYAASIYDLKYKQATNITCQCLIETFMLANITFGVEGHYRSFVGKNLGIRSLVDHDTEHKQLASCNGNETVRYDLTFYAFNLDKNVLYVDPSVAEGTVPIDIRLNQISCAYNYSVAIDEDFYDCNGDNTKIRKSQLCIYDEDATGYIIGCRSGMHLQNCDDFDCPRNTVKCPNSYCISLRFVCDGRFQCPGGQDEHNCTCDSKDRDIIIMIEDTKRPTHSQTAAELLAKQFSSGNSEVRLLYFKGKPRIHKFPLIHRLLEIREKYMLDFDAISSDCTYKTMARNILPSLQFSKRETKAIVFIEDSIESSTVAKIMFSNISNQAFKMYRVIKNFSYSVDNKRTYDSVNDVRISRWNALHAVGYRLFPEICKEASYVPCAGGFRCYSSKQCIPLNQVCDGIAQCINRDDEHMCDFECHQKCKCGGGVVECREVNLTILEIHALSRRTRSADLSHNIRIKDVLSTENLHFPFMLNLDVSYCNIELVSNMAFSDINNLLKLNLSYNFIKALANNVFGDLRHLVELDLDGNSELMEISSLAFQGLQSIKALRISGTKLKKISTLTFSNLKLQTIDISNNNILEIENYAFSNTSVNKINFEGNKIIKFHKLIFKDVFSLNELRTPAYKFCCIRPCYVKERNCYPPKNEFSSCDDLMRHPILQAVLWLVGLASLFGNLGSIVYRIVYDRQRLKIGYGIFVTNLASADFLMGVYLIVIACVDSVYRSRYIYMDDQWRNSIWCTLTGFLSTVSSEASVFFLCLITIDRLLVIKYPFGHVRFTPKSAHICCCICWLIATTLAAIPIFYTSYFKNKFYSRSGVCIALPLSRDKPPGWMYSVSIFVGLNFGTFILVAFGQLSIFLELRKSSMGVKKTQQSRKRDLQVAKNLILVATTDFLCWFPIGLMGIISLNGYSISGDVYAWTAVFILPLNSALNPFLYTLSAIIGKKTFNPSIEEQSRIEIERERGSAILQYTDVSRSVRTKRELVPGGKTRKIKDVLDENMSVASVTAISYQLANYLDLLHNSSITVENLSETNTFIRYRNKKAKRPIIVLDTKMTLVDDDKKKAENIYQYGCLLRKMVARCKTKD
ncbi:uncharacterized protein LOC132742201 [Ruditapes philippinarum]|uniref:uncharacterized protein LOC132742201 n=1 Tax=Ruditapes philippinarum TaxID=129788 RepID=UPI00295B51B1|nr:uncharacterized protein LOC132742201 [Ruditapes philippinarum]